MAKQKMLPNEAHVRKQYGLEPDDKLPLERLKKDRDSLMSEVHWNKGLTSRQMKLLKAINRVLAKSFYQ